MSEMDAEIYCYACGVEKQVDREGWKGAGSRRARWVLKCITNRWME